MVTRGTIWSFLFSYKWHLLVSGVLCVGLFCLDQFLQTMLFPILVGVAGIVSLVVVIIRSPKVELSITGFDSLHEEMIWEMERMAKNAPKASSSQYLVTLSFTPAFGNISNALSYYERASDHSYERAVEVLVHAGVSVNMVCYNREKREEFHKYWAKLRSEDEGKPASRLVRQWEDDALRLIKLVRDKFGEEAVKEVENIHPIFVFATNNVAFLYAMKEDHTTKKNDIVGTKITNPTSITFITESVKGYLAPNPVVQMFDNALDKTDRQEARRQGDILVGKIREKYIDRHTDSEHSSITDTDILIAYGGGKDSTWALALIRYIQELVRERYGVTFTLHVVSYLHPGMGSGVIRNFRNVFQHLRIQETEEVEVFFATVDQEEIVCEKVLNDDWHYPTQVIQRSRREILLLGHLSQGLGRQTFCYTCNLNMVMTVLSYISTRRDRRQIDFLITGDTEKENAMYRDWIRSVVSEQKGIKPAHAHDAAGQLIKHLYAIKREFDKFLRNNRVHARSPLAYSPPMFMELFTHFNYNYASHKDVLEEKLGFILFSDSFNFTESDCIYPAIMAHLAGLRGECDCGSYNRYLTLHVERMQELMKKKEFDPRMQNKAIQDFYPSITPKKHDEIVKFLNDNLHITEKQLKAMAHSPFLNSAKQLQIFLEKMKVDLEAETIVQYIAGEGLEEDRKVVEFLEEYIGLDRTDVHYIYTQQSLCHADNILARIAKGDPYVQDCDLNGVNVVISGR